MPEYDSVVLSCMHMFVSDEQNPRLVRSMPTLGKPIILSPPGGILFSETGSSLGFGQTPQDALTLLGSPQYISYKKSNPSIYERLHIRDNIDYQYDYFYNYFELGLDILFDASGHHIKKFIVH